MKLSRLVLASLFVLSAACGSDKKDPPSLPDASDNPNPDAAARSCSIPSSLGTLGGLTFQSVVRPQDPPPADQAIVFASLIAITDAGPPIDFVNIQLWPGFGPFAAGLAPGTYPLSGDETNFYLCGACALLAGNFDQAAGVEQDFVASGGTLTLTTASTEIGMNIEGTLTGATFREVTFDDDTQTQTDVAGGCSVTIDSVAFTATNMAPMMPRQAAPTSPRRRR